MSQKQLIAVIAIVSLVVVWFYFGQKSFDPTKVVNYPPSGRKVVAFGDSLVSGVGSTEGNDFVSVLSRRLAVSIENLGRPGDTTETALERLDSVRDLEPDIVILLLGGNDFIQKVDTEETAKNLQTIIKTFNQDGAIVVMLGVQSGILSDKFSGEFARLARQNRTAYIPDILDGIFNKRELMSDRIHPNNQGYRIVADRVYPIVEALLP